MNFKNKRVLITAGSTWVSIDNVRVISNIATAETGRRLAQRLANAGAKVTLIINSNCLCGLSRKIRIIPFRFFEQLKDYLRRELLGHRYDIVIHSAAVSDYKPQRPFRRKIKSGKKDWSIRLSPTPKLIAGFRAMRPKLRIVGFKFEPDSTSKTLVKNAQQLLKQAGLDLVVANTNKNDKYRAYIVNGGGAASGALGSKEEMIDLLMRYLGEQKWRN
jgi:phosphopantothenoylcysteine decarboxylase/phosphopantothenate--cysteine ligase